MYIYIYVYTIYCIFLDVDQTSYINFRVIL